MTRSVTYPAPGPGVTQLDGPGLGRLIESVRKLSPARCADYNSATVISESSLAAMVDETTIEQLLAEGVMQSVESSDGTIDFVPNLTFWNAGGLVTVLPSHTNPDTSEVYLAGDTLWLLEFLWKRGLTGKLAADIGSGHGFLAAALASRFEQVVATDIDPTCVRYMAATLRANGLMPPRGIAIQADVATGLEPGSFDLVAGNAPWSPAPPRNDSGAAAVWADGGHRGTELPLRFITQSAQLLAPGGEAVILCLDTEWDDGETPLQSGITCVREMGFEVEMHATDVIPPSAYERLLGKTEGLAAAQHVAVVVNRPLTNGHRAD